MAKLPPNEGSMLEEMLIALVAMSKSFSTYYCKQEKATEILLKGRIITYQTYPMCLH